MSRNFLLAAGLLACALAVVSASAPLKITILVRGQFQLAAGERVRLLGCRWGTFPRNAHDSRLHALAAVPQQRDVDPAALQQRDRCCGGCQLQLAAAAALHRSLASLTRFRRPSRPCRLAPLSLASLTRVRRPSRPCSTRRLTARSRRKTARTCRCTTSAPSRTAPSSTRPVSGSAGRSAVGLLHRSRGARWPCARWPLARPHSLPPPHRAAADDRNEPFTFRLGAGQARRSSGRHALASAAPSGPVLLAAGRWLPRERSVSNLCHSPAPPLALRR